MSEETKHINYSAADIEKYHRGELPAAQMHAMEKAALDDPFLADAMEGYGVQGSEPAINDLKKRLAERIAEKQRTPVLAFAWWKVAAVILVMIGAGWFYISNNSKSNQAIVAKNKELNKEIPLPAATDSIKSSYHLTDTTVAASDVAINERNKSVKEKFPATSFKAERRQEVNDSTVSTVLSEAPLAKNAAPEIKSLQRSDYLKDELEKPAVKNDSVGSQLAISNSATSENFISADKKIKTGPNANTFANNNQAGISRPVTTNTFNGFIVDDANRPLANTTIQIPHLNFATVTNAKGYFSFKARDTALSVSVASAGFETQNIELTTNSIADDNVKNVIRLKPSLINLNEVVVTGYGTQKKKDITTAKTNDVTIRILDAEPTTGWNEYNQYLEKNKKVPDSITDIHGDVTVSFTIGNNGALKNFRIEKSLHEQLDAEAIRLIKNGPSWRLLKGKNAKAFVTVKF